MRKSEVYFSFGALSDDFSTQLEKQGYKLKNKKTKEEWVVANLVTKFKYYNKPTYDSVKNALVDMKRQCVERGLCHIAMPQIACGLDGLSWSQIRRTIKDVFEDSNFEIVVYIR